jgi:hypothetical protein
MMSSLQIEEFLTHLRTQDRASWQRYEVTSTGLVTVAWPLPL